MALINCPECGKEVSDKASACIHCGYPLQDLKEKTPSSSVNNKEVTAFSKPTIYKPCTPYFVLNKTMQSPNHQIWGSVVGGTIKTGDMVDLCDENYDVLATCAVTSVYSMGANNKIICFSRLTQEILDKCQHIVYCNCGHSVHNICEPISFKEAPIPVKPLSIKKMEDIIKCPKCGSTQIQMVPRKWSLATGFLTNQVDRVCMRCKHKF